MASTKVRVTHEAPGFAETEIPGDWTTVTANAYVDRTEAVTGTIIRIYHGSLETRRRVCDPRG